MTIIGSTAIKHYFPDFNRKPKDLDFVYEGDVKPILVARPPLVYEYLKNDVLIDYLKNNNFVLPKFCPINELYTLKISHSFWSLNNNSWDKHLWDIQFLKSKGAVFIESLFYDLFDYWSKMHGERKASNLEMSKEDFFNNAIRFHVEHDDIHEILIKHPYFKGQEKPMYTHILKEGEEVNVCEEKFNTLNEDEKFNLVFEEVANMAFERYSHMPYKQAYSFMLKKFIISHCPVWEGIWIIQNHKELLTRIPFNYMAFLKEKTDELKTN